MRKVIKLSYIFIIKLLDKLYHPAVHKDKIVVMMTFKEDMIPLINRLVAENLNLTILYHPKHQRLIEQYSNIKTIPLSNKYIIQQLLAIKSARTIVIDTYYLMLGSLQKNKQQEVIQLWHAVCALKTFGLKDRSINLSDKKLIKNYQAVYDFTDSYVVAGHAMENIFKEYLNADKKRFLKFGLPRLDEHIDEKQVTEVSEQLWNNKSPKVLFVPTYRDYQLKQEHRLEKEHFEGLVIKAHPSDHNYQSTTDFDTDVLIEGADIVITDYSSLAVEAAYRNKRVLFFVPDEDIYRQSRGLNHYYDLLSKKAKAATIDELKKILSHPSKLPINEWVEYQHHAVDQLVHHIKESK